MDKIEEAADIIARSKKIVVFTSAGISTESVFLGVGPSQVIDSYGL